MMAHSFGDVLLVPFPFVDQSGAKKRPAVIVSSSGYNASHRDLVFIIPR
jgi:mRNA interferase MazF